MSLYTTVFLGFLALAARRRGSPRRFRLAWGGGAYLAMLGQLLCLYLSGLLSVQTALPLHLCSFSGVLCLPMLLCEKPWLNRFFLRLAAPGAAVALLVPCPMPTFFPTVSDFCFYALHGFLLFSPLLIKGGSGRPLGMLALCLGLLMLAIIANRLFSANYLFLNALPPGISLGPVDGWPMEIRALALLVLSSIVCWAEAPGSFRKGRLFNK